MIAGVPQTLFLRWLGRGARRRPATAPQPPADIGSIPQVIGLIAGNTSFPIRFARLARSHGRKIIAVCHHGETDPAIENDVDQATWIKVGELGTIIETFKNADCGAAVMAGGINRVRLFGGVKLDMRGAALLLKLRSAKDDVIMRGIADELAGEGIPVLPCTLFMEQDMAPAGVLTKSKPTKDELEDIDIGRAAIAAMSSQDIGQVVVVREGVVVAVEAVEGTDAAIRRGGELGGKGGVVVKFAKATQDMRFDVPTVGPKTIESLIAAKARVLAVEAGKCLILDRDEVLDRANRNGISIVGCVSGGAESGIQS